MKRYSLTRVQLTALYRQTVWKGGQIGKRGQTDSMERRTDRQIVEKGGQIGKRDRQTVWKGAQTDR